jgi:hypothetical protein
MTPVPSGQPTRPGGPRRRCPPTLLGWHRRLVAATNPAAHAFVNTLRHPELLCGLGLPMALSVADARRLRNQKLLEGPSERRRPLGSTEARHPPGSHRFRVGSSSLATLALYGSEGRGVCAKCPVAALSRVERQVVDRLAQARPRSAAWRAGSLASGGTTDDRLRRVSPGRTAANRSEWRTAVCWSAVADRQRPQRGVAADQGPGLDRLAAPAQRTAEDRI